MSGLTKTVTTELSELLLGGIPLIAVSFADKSSDRDLAGAQAGGLDVAELRIDRYSSADDLHVVKHVQRFSAFPTIATIRTSGEGGDWRGTESERLHLFKAVVPEVHGIDIELSSVDILLELVEVAKFHGKVVIISTHNFDGTPSSEQLDETAAKAKSLGADYVKVAAMAKSAEDVRTLAAFTLRNASLGLIVVAMGPHGGVSRVFFPALGSRLTYAHAGEHAVPGQLGFAETFDLLRRFYPAFNQKKINDLELLEDA